MGREQDREEFRRVVKAKRQSAAFADALRQESPQRYIDVLDELGFAVEAQLERGRLAAGSTC